MSDLIIDTLSNWNISILFLKCNFQCLFHFTSLISLHHFIISDNSLEIQFSSDSISCRHNVVQIHVFNKRLNISLLLYFLLAHSLCHFSWVSLDSCYQSMRIFSFFGSFFTGFYDYCLFACLSSV